MPQYPQRKSPRLQGYDYSQSGAYFVTICTHKRQHLFGYIANDIMHHSAAGEIALACWQSIPQHYPDVELDIFVVMPNHVHGIVLLLASDANFQTLLGRVINAYKGAVTSRIRKQQNDALIVWQARYHDHIIRDEASLNRIREYVQYNSELWTQDTFFSES